MHAAGSHSNILLKPGKPQALKDIFMSLIIYIGDSRGNWLIIVYSQNEGFHFQ